MRKGHSAKTLERDVREGLRHANVEEPDDDRAPADEEGIDEVVMDVLDSGDGDDSDEAVSDGSPIISEETGDLMQAYFRSMGHISLLSRAAETEIAKRLAAGRERLRECVAVLPFYQMLEGRPASRDGGASAAGEETADALATTLEMLDGLLSRISEAEQLQRAVRLGAGSAEKVLQVYRQAEAESGVSIRDLKETCRRLAAIREELDAVKNELVMKNLRLVITIAKSYIGRGLPLIDLIQEGNIGLMKAAERFRHDRGCKFSTYAIWWIRQAITRSLMDQGRTIRVPVHVMEFHARVVRTARALTQQFGREANAEEVAARMGVPAKKVEEIYTVMQDTVALQSVVGDDDSELGDFIVDHASLSPDDELQRIETARRIRGILKSLPPKEAKIIRMRYGIGVGRDHTLEEVGRHFSITRERVRQIEIQALRRLRQAARLKTVEQLAAT